MKYQYEYTDTFGGESNYSWVNRGEIDARTWDHAFRLARKELGLTGCKGEYSMDCGDMKAWKPRGMCTILFVNWAD